jgi:hypothetical protein
MFNKEKNLNFSIKCVKNWKQNITFLKGYSTNITYKYIIIIHLHLVIFSIILISSKKIQNLFIFNNLFTYITYIGKEGAHRTHSPTYIEIDTKKNALCAKNLEDKKRDVKMPWHLEKNLVCHLGVEININMQPSTLVLDQV